MSTFAPLYVMLFCLLVAARLPAAVIYTKLPEIYDANARNVDDPRGFITLPLDFNGDGKSEFVITTELGGVSIYHPLLNRVFIRSDPPPNLGGSAASIIGGAEIAGNSENASFRWYQGQPVLELLFLEENPDLPGRLTSIGLAFTEGTIGHTRGKDGYLGFEFTLDDGLHYAWLHFDASGNATRADGSYIGVGGYIDGWTWETTPGRGIVAGAIPEPSVWVLVSLCSSFTVLRRKRD